MSTSKKSQRQSLGRGNQLGQEDQDQSAQAGRALVPTETVKHVGPNDVLMGRGAPITENPGNVGLRQLVIKRHAEYAQCKLQKHKHIVALRIVQDIAEKGGRFLRRVTNQSSHTDNASTKGENNAQGGSKPSLPEEWEIVTDEKQITGKIKQLLRDMGPEASSRRMERRKYRYRKLGLKSTVARKDKEDDQSCNNSQKQTVQNTSTEDNSSKDSPSANLTLEAALSRTAATNRQEAATKKFKEEEEKAPTDRPQHNSVNYNFIQAPSLNSMYRNLGRNSGDLFQQPFLGMDNSDHSFVGLLHAAPWGVDARQSDSSRHSNTVNNGLPTLLSTMSLQQQLQAATAQPYREALLSTLLSNRDLLGSPLNSTQASLLLNELDHSALSRHLLQPRPSQLELSSTARLMSSLDTLFPPALGPSFLNTYSPSTYSMGAASSATTHRFPSVGTGTAFPARSVVPDSSTVLLQRLLGASHLPRQEDDPLRASREANERHEEQTDGIPRRNSKDDRRP